MSVVAARVAERIRKPHWSLARTWLLQPGLPGGGEAFDAAAAGRADIVVLDIEDGLPEAQKAAGRHAVAEYLSAGGRAWVRINCVSTAAWSADLDAVAQTPGLAGVMLAKAEGADDVAATAARLPDGLPVVALIESALGIESALDIARTAACARIAFGLGDFRRDTGMSDDPTVLAYARARLVIASRAARRPAPIDGPTLRAATNRLARDTAVAKAAGMTGRLCLDPAHAETINTLLSPSEMEIDEARRTLALLDAPAGPYDGSVGPTKARAQAVLDLAAKLGLE
ncbi:aldolase/citrate lyase family protein [Mycolicibacterium sp. 120266]|jgi:citrate lyase subunit beta/citryl-CoA lyase|uniref:HpcH/HpaI aldolase/citrate lyase family protein n=1 Tax=Mycolicibacterium sp. 120266 TaxID=3090601 RepID=UPI00299F07D3|nr:aldolase/citrate lyase family protein [Mycolicibacterium sp. 120266]MDX1872027.1 aldolase/citrate lyase family protein [Mycolicibacterium sp. 120266]